MTLVKKFYDLILYGALHWVVLKDVHGAVWAGLNNMKARLEL